MTDHLARCRVLVGLALVAGLVLACGSPVSSPTSVPPTSKPAESAAAATLPALPPPGVITSLDLPVPTSLPADTSEGLLLPDAALEAPIEAALAIVIDGTTLETAALGGDELSAISPDLVASLTAAGVQPGSITFGFGSDPTGAASVRLGAVSVAGMTGGALAEILRAVSPGLEEAEVAGRHILLARDPATYFYASELGLFVLQGPPDEVIEALAQLP